MIKDFNCRAGLINYRNLCACCGAHYIDQPLSVYQHFNGIAVSDKVLVDILPIEPVVVQTKNGPLYIYLTEGTTP